MKITLRNDKVDEKIQALQLEKNNIEDIALLDGRDLTDEEQLKVEEIQKKIEYMNNNAERTYVAPFIKGELYKDLFKVQELAEDPTNPDNLVKIIDFICNIYGNQFTSKQFLKGIKMSELTLTIMDTITSINRMVMEGVEPGDTQR